MSLRGITLDTFIGLRMITETCYSCGAVFAMESEFKRRRLDDHSLQFYCPNGHQQHYIGQTDAERERERADRYRDWLEQERERVEQERRSHAATKGTLTKTRKRLAGGVCPCCNRTFENLQRHMHTKHPDYAEELVMPPAEPHPSEIIGSTLRERLYAALADGKPHTVPELAKLLNANPKSIAGYLSVGATSGRVQRLSTGVYHVSA